MYPTAIELTGLSTKIPASLEGYSLAPLLKDPALQKTSPSLWRTAAFSQYPRCARCYSRTTRSNAFIGLPLTCVLMVCSWCAHGCLARPCTGSQVHEQYDGAAAAVPRHT